MRRFMFLLVLLFAVSADSFAQNEARLLRFPAIYENTIVFTYAGDLYTVPTEGGVARRLTSDDGFEMFPRFSPDGSTIAFTGQYDGNTEVYTIPAQGGKPVRITYTATLGRDDVSDRMGPNNIVMGWKNGDEIVFRSRMKEPNSFNGQLFTVNKNGAIHRQIPVPRGGFISFSSDGSKFAYNRIFREFRTWKRYRGGMADDIWVYDAVNQTVNNVTNNPAQDVIPMWHQDKIYFLSDRDNNKRMNLYVLDSETAQARKLTNFTDFDIKFPSLGKNAIVFEQGGYIHRFDLQSERTQKVPVQINEDLITGRGGLTKVNTFITNYEISPDGKRALLGARGELFTVPAKNGNTRNLSNTSGIHERNSKWSPDGKWIAYISDKPGENEIFVRLSDGTGEEMQITRNADTYYYQMYWSPDSKKLVWADKMNRLRYVDIDDKKIVEIDRSRAFEFFNYSWSPDSKWITYAKNEFDTMNKVYIYSLADKKSHAITKGWFTSGQPVFSGDNKFLFFVSARDFNPIYSATEWNHAYQDMSRIYFVSLNKDVESPFKPVSDEVEIEDEEEKPEAEEKPAESNDGALRIDFDGIQERIAVLPISVSNYFNLTAVGSKLYYMRNGSRDTQSHLLVYDLNTQKETDLGNINGYEISADKKKMLVSQSGSYGIIGLPSSKITLSAKLNVSNLEMELDRQAEWRQIFDESWRQMRDFFYDPNMHGVNWSELKSKYRPMVEHVNHRADLTYVIGEMIGELNVGHAYVGGGDRPTPARIQLGHLGAVLEKDANTGYFRIKKILKGQNWTNNVRSPLTEIGVNAKEGDYILAVNGESTSAMPNMNKALVNTVGKQVTLTLNATPADDGKRETVVRPIAGEAPLYYYNMVQTNIEKVTTATNGKVGYIHVPDMGPNGLNEFIKHFYPQLSKKALIIDVRGNGGGNVSPMLIERLRREVILYNAARNIDPSTDPGAVVDGPKVALIDEFSASDGDIFAYRFKEYELGKTIGKRTWGGVVGIRGSLPIIDGGSLQKPEFSRFSKDGEWVMEGYGVDPDIYVDNDPIKEFNGEDEQLNRGIAEILEELRTKEKIIPKKPAFPKKKK